MDRFIGTNDHEWTSVGLGEPLETIVREAYAADNLHAVFLTPCLAAAINNDYISHAPDAGRPLPANRFSASSASSAAGNGGNECVLAPEICQPDNPGLQPAERLMHSLNLTEPERLATASKALRGGIPAGTVEISRRLKRCPG